MASKKPAKKAPVKAAASKPKPAAKTAKPKGFSLEDRVRLLEEQALQHGHHLPHVAADGSDPPHAE